MGHNEERRAPILVIGGVNVASLVGLPEFPETEGLHAGLEGGCHCFARLTMPPAVFTLNLRHMSAKRFKKLLMAHRYSRDRAAALAHDVQTLGHSYGYAWLLMILLGLV